MSLLKSYKTRKHRGNFTTYLDIFIYMRYFLACPEPFAWNGEDCETECLPRWMGDNCDECATAWIGENCDQCANGYYGENCGGTYIF